MDIESLDVYKKQRILLQKSFITRLNSNMQEFLDDWNELPLIKKTIYRTKFDTCINDTSKRIKDETTKLRLLKKCDPNDIMQSDIDDLIACKNALPKCRNAYEWITKFRGSFLSMDCFARFVLFSRIDCFDLWEESVMNEIINSDMPDIESKDYVEQAQTMHDLVSGIISKGQDKYIEEQTDDFFDTISGQMSMNI